MITFQRLSQLAQQIKIELQDSISAHPAILTDEVIDVFLKTLVWPVGDSSVQLDGLETRVPEAMEKMFLEDLPRSEQAAYFPEMARVEAYLQKILFLVNRLRYQQLKADRKGLAVYIRNTGINPGNIHLGTATEQSVAQSANFGDHLFRMYSLRNIESHQCVLWNRYQLAANITSTLVMFLYATYRNLPALSALVNQEPDLSAYLRKVVADFERWQQRFVHITGIEKFEEIDLFAIESEDWDTENQNELREGKIDELRKNIVERSMVVLGEPGMGKSTTMQYMAYGDAKALLVAPASSLPIPVYLELKLFSLQDTIEAVTAHRLGISEEKVSEYLIRGKLTLFLDGLNEVLADLRRPIRAAVQELILQYPQANLIITSRPLAYANEFKTSPVFVLQRMEDMQIDEFLQKNCSRETIRRIIIGEIRRNIRLGKIVRVPLLLKMLINVVLHNKGSIPDNKVQIIKIFIQNLYERESRKMISDTDFRVIHRLLCFVAYLTRERNGSNVGWRADELEAVMESRIEESRFKLSVFDFLDTAVDLNILVKDDDKYSFIHELYQEYYAAEEMFRKNVKKNGQTQGNPISKTVGGDS